MAKMLNGKEEVWPRLKPIIQEIRTSLLCLSEAEVVYYPRNPRSGNKVADRIAKETTTFTSIVPKLYFIPPVWLCPSLQADCIL
ncbi:hypothetical protein DY000_02046221 [Brassica cretica]|uniref:RNase H type-1 domain-containing protein n=1 Tax=Brassica cretica TaxID=69181 RepID=A0ABQ7EYG7_BRACR|nr:hypothetical protein DY000_02046221 [Brassica cretica]